MVRNEEETIDREQGKHEEGDRAKESKDEDKQRGEREGERKGEGRRVK